MDKTYEIADIFSEDFSLMIYLKLSFILDLRGSNNIAIHTSRC